MKTDSDIKRDIEAELQSDPSIDATDIAVAVKNGVVTLTGFVRSYSEKLEAEAAAKRVASVVGLANDLEVRLSAADQRPDPEIARDAVAAIKSQLPFSLAPDQGGRRQGMGDARGPGRVELSARGRGAGGPQGQRRPGRDQHDSTQAWCRANRDQTQDRGGLSAQRRDRREPDHCRN
jgi:hypothetical protein